MRIRRILKRIYLNQNIINNHQVSDCFTFSSKVTDESIFVCIKGSNSNGHDFINEAISNGAKTIIYSEELTEFNNNINYIRVDNPKRVYAQIITILFKDLSKKMVLIGITGTNGKTTVSTMVHSFFEYMGCGSLYIGTNTIEYLSRKYPNKNTTPDIKVIYEYLRLARKENIRYVVMEVSSIAVMELRVLGLKFQVIGLTNISQDHLDYHKNMTHYVFSKLLAVFQLKKGPKSGLVLNKDDAYYDLFNKFYQGNIITYAIDNKANINAKIVNKSFKETNFTLNGENMRTYLIGDFNIYNILCVAGILKILSFSFDDLKGFLRCFQSVKGRMNVYGLKDKTIIIDYAHTPDGVLNILRTLKELSKAQITVVIGAGGNRDKEKRPLIGQVVDKYADKIILTNDNPRDEDPEVIINEIALGISKEYVVEMDRKKAIHKAITESSINEVIAILGKGCEEKQVLKNETIRFSDIEVLKEIIGG